MSKNRVKPERITISGEAKWVQVVKPDMKFKKETGEYSVQLLISEDQHKGLVKKLTPMAEKARESAAAEAATPAKAKKIRAFEISLPIGTEEDKEGNETGMYVAKCKSIAAFKKKDGSGLQNITIPVFDAGMSKMMGDKIGRGSRLRVSVDLVPWCIEGQSKAGVQLRLVGVQVLELVEYGGNSNPEDMGFKAEDGYKAAPSDKSDDAPFDGGGTEGGDDGGGDF